MLVQEEAYFNFVNSINSEVTKKSYVYCLSKFLKYCNLELDSLLGLPTQDLSNRIIRYLVSLKISSQYKNVYLSAINHACEMNDITLNWKKIKKFISYEKTDNEINGRDRDYTDKEIRTILEFSDQHLKTAFLVLASTGMRIGALESIRISDLERIDNLYKIIVYTGEKEEYFTFCTPECAREIDAYFEYRTRRGEDITQDSFLFVKKFNQFTKNKRKSIQEYIQIKTSNGILIIHRKHQ